uniref:Uncharacterized protein n=1 Tax=Rhizophora mucronata TaxID=61149 RepID=A0A2P2P802_RHIMU
MCSHFAVWVEEE